MKYYRFAGLVSILLIIIVVGFGLAATGVLFTSNSTCTTSNVNEYTNKLDVYIRGENFPDGYYYVQVTTPNGDLLGTSVGCVCATPIHAIGGTFGCYQLWEIVNKTSDPTQHGFDETTNPNGTYKVQVSLVSSFTGGTVKQKNFNITAPPLATLNVLKFYDANANGVDDDNQYLTGWKVNISNTTTAFDRSTNVTEILEPGTWTVSEYTPIEDSWRNTTPLSVVIVLSPGDDATVKFGNLCLGPGGGFTIGFWGNKNGEALIGEDDLALLTSLNLVNANGDAFDPVDYDSLDAWLQDAKAVNMANMLSAQLAAMELNVNNGFVNGNAMIYAPNATSANFLGYATVDDVMTEANATLGADSYTISGDSNRAYQQGLKDDLDNANNNQTFVQPVPCIFTFA